MKDLKFNSNYFTDVFSSIPNSKFQELFDIQMNSIAECFYNDSAMIWEDDGCEYDCSGRIKKISNSHSFGDFLEMLNGKSIPTYTSGCGLHYQSYEDGFQDDIIEISYDLAKEILINKEKISSENEEEFWQIVLEEYDHDIHDNLVMPIQYALINILEEEKNSSLFNFLKKYKYENHKNS